MSISCIRLTIDTYSRDVSLPQMMSWKKLYDEYLEQVLLRKPSSYPGLRRWMSNQQKAYLSGMLSNLQTCLLMEIPEFCNRVLSWQEKFETYAYVSETLEPDQNVLTYREDVIQGHPFMVYEFLNKSGAHYRLDVGHWLDEQLQDFASERMMKERDRKLMEVEQWRRCRWFLELPWLEKFSHCRIETSDVAEWWINQHWNDYARLPDIKLRILRQLPLWKARERKYGIQRSLYDLLTWREHAGLYSLISETLESREHIEYTVFDPMGLDWKTYSPAVFRSHRHLNSGYVTTEEEGISGVQLGKWVATQRNLFIDDVLDEMQMSDLASIPAWFLLSDDTQEERKKLYLKLAQREKMIQRISYKPDSLKFV